MYLILKNFIGTLNINKSILSKELFFILGKTAKIKLFLFIMLLTTVVYFFSYLLSPFSNGDPAFYTIIGRSYIRDWILPYGYIFDHKPIFIYVLYGLWDMIFPFFNGKFAILSILLSIFFVFSCSYFGKYNKLVAAFILLVVGSPFDPLSGNSEILIVSFEAVCFFFIVSGNKKNKSYYYILSGFIAALVLNINYLSVVCLSFPLMILLFLEKKNLLRRTLFFSTGLFVGFAFIFIPFFIKGNHALENYFYLQSNYMNHYSGSYSDRVFSLLLESTYGIISIPVFLLWIDNKISNLWRRDLTLPAWAASSFIATLLSGHPFSHYFLLCFAPISIMMAILIQEHKKIRAWYIYFILSGSMVFMAQEARQNFRTYTFNQRIDFNKIDAEIGKNSVLSIRAYQTLFYFSHISSFDKYLFHTHIDILYGNHADQYFILDLKKKPKYVVTEYNACTLHKITNNICDILSEKYTIFYEKSVREGKYNRFSITIYKIR